ncbi:RecBCD enzyme subunit RecD [Betaproteobacteria bacterium]|nr:RecBCD enzyme subunit RecD [Betaproteobacteria bacterium]
MRGMNTTHLLNSRESLLKLLRDWSERGWLRELDVALARFFADLDANAAPLLLLGAALTSHQLGRGHVCLDLAATLKNPDAALSLSLQGETENTAAQLLNGLSLATWQDALTASPLLSDTNSPLVIAGTRLYLRRYWQYERAVADRLAAFRQAAVNVPPDLESHLSQLFTADNSEQKQACATAARHRFAIITGGPGTGKTTTVVRLLALLQTVEMAAGRSLTIKLAAPTGKAAARLTESIRAQVDALPVADEVRANIPREVATVHRLLGTLPGSRHFRHNQQNPLQLDVLVIDEASMVSLEMMANLLDALPATARLILLGDKDQLASVEAGAVLGDLCATDAPHIAKLTHSHRFGNDSGIGQLAQAVNAGHAPAARELFGRQISAVQLSADDPALNELLREGYAAYLNALNARPTSADVAAVEKWATKVLAAFDQFRLLCAVREGAWGVEEQNRRIVQTLYQREDRGWYTGRPVMVTQNDYSLNLMNGDIGIALELPDGLRVVFPKNDGNPGLRYLHPSRLGEVETAFAMTVHKSQGSEFAHTALLLPDASNPILTRELLYTAITRAKTRFSLIESGEDVFEDAVARRVERYSGLSNANL